MGTAAKSPSSLASMFSLPAPVNPVAVLVMIIGLLSLFVPTYITLADEVWNNDAHGHGPLILGGVALAAVARPAPHPGR